METHIPHNSTKTRQQIAAEYGITTRTFRRWLKKHGVILPNRLLCPREQQTIYTLFGDPNQLINRESDSA